MKNLDDYLLKKTPKQRYILWEIVMSHRLETIYPNIKWFKNCQAFRTNFIVYQTRMDQPEGFLPIPEDLTLDKCCKQMTVYDAFVEDGDLFRI